VRVADGASRFRRLGFGIRFFTSDRERRLWVWALVVVLAIWSTLGLAGRLAEQFGESGLLAVAFILGFLLAIVAVVWSALGRRPGRHEIWVVLGVAAAYGMGFVRMGAPVAERTHLFEYGLVALLVYQALRERLRSEGRVFLPAALAVVITALLGWVDEGIQWLLPSRVYDTRDVAVNSLAGLMAIVASLVLERARR
jgi:VanZ family protein